MQQIFFLPILATIFLVVHSYTSYDLKCPEAVHWKQRALGKCGQSNRTEKYYCLHDNLNGSYTEGCTGPDVDRTGQRRIISGSFTRGNCSTERYQPFDFWTNGSSDCVYTKSLCSEEGQITSNHGLGNNDRTCRCDYARGYNYIQPPKDLCNCRPTTEDCTCVQVLNCTKTNVEGHKVNQDILLKPIRNIQNNIQFSNIGRDEIIYVTILMVSMLFASVIYIVRMLPSEKGIEKREVSGNEEINYLRIVHLLYAVASPVVRMVFNADFKPEEPLPTSVQNSKIDECFRGETMSSYLPDIESIGNLLKDKGIIRVGDLLPFRSDMSIDALFGRILYYRTLIVDTVDGKLGDREFQNCWRDIRQTILRMSTRHLTDINRNIILKEHLLSLSPIREDDIRLQRYVLWTERFPQLILQQLISEYFLKNRETLSSFLKDNIHLFFHQRKKQSYCCKCLLEMFNHMIPDVVWNQLYLYQDKNIAHCCTGRQKCVFMFDINPKFDLNQADTSVLIILILTKPQLRRYIFRKMYANSLPLFLKRSKHSIFHAVDTFVNVTCCHYHDESCAQAKSMLLHDDWVKLFTHEDKSACTIDDCSCQFSVKGNVNIKTLDDTLIFKIMSVAGPFKVFDKRNKNTLNDLLRWNDEKGTFIGANKELLSAVKDSEFVKNLKGKLSLSGPKAEHFDIGFVKNWILKNVSTKKATTCSKTDEVLLLNDEVEELAVHYVDSASIPFSGNSKIARTQEETNFLKLHIILNQVVCPVVRLLFDRHMSSDKLDKIFSDIYYRDLDFQEKQTNANRNRKNSYNAPLKLSPVQRSRIFERNQVGVGAGSDALDLSLLIILLEENMKSVETLKNVEELNLHLVKIKGIRRMITESPSGLIKDEEFKEIWNTLSKVVNGLTDEEQYLSRLKDPEILMWNK